MRKILRGHVFNIRFLFTLCVGFACSETRAQMLGSYTINSAVATGGRNFQSFTDAAAKLATGVSGAVTFNVSGGPYNEQVIINAITGTSATSPVIFNCNGVTLTFLSTDYNQRAGVKLNGADYVTFDNLNVVPQAATDGEYGYGFHLLNDADHNTIKNCHITNVVDEDNPDDHEGIVINGNDGPSWDDGTSFCDDNLILNNTVTGGSVGVTLNSSPVSGPAQLMTGNKIIGNTFTNNLYNGVQMYYTSGTLIEGNDISGGPDVTGTMWAIYLYSDNEGYTINKNSIHGYHLTGGNVNAMFIASDGVAGKTSLISNNLIYDLQTPSDIYGMNIKSSTGYLNIYNNTISIDDKVVVGDNTLGIYFESAINDVNMMNNIITITRKSSSFAYGLYFNDIPVNYASQRNVIYVPKDPNILDGVVLYNTLTYNTMAAWQKAAGYDYFSTDVNPGYVNGPGFNFRPTAQSIDNLASNVGLTTDITGAARDANNPDPGCYEFTSSACATTITPGSTSVLPDSILCLGPKVSLALTGNSAGGGQTYTWQSSTTATGGYTDISSPLGFPFLETTPVTTKYYRVALTCGGTTAYSNPVHVLVNAGLNAGTYTINSALPTGGINFNSFTDAVRAMQCSLNGSVVFNVTPGSGPYNEQLILPDLGTSPTKTITFNGNGATISYAPTTSSQSAVVKLNGIDYVTIDSLTVEVKGATTYGFGIQLINDADHNTIKRCTVNLNKTATNLRYAGIVINSSDSDPVENVFASNCDSNLIINNTVNGGCYGITLASKGFSYSFSNLKGNIIRRNTFKDNSNFGMFISGASYCTIDSNDMSQPTRTVLYGQYGGIYLMGYSFGLTVSKNTIHNLGENARNTVAQFDGIRCENGGGMPTDPNIVTNNLIYSFRGSGFQNGIINLSSNYTKFYHNTISLDDSMSVDPGVTRGFSNGGTLTQGVEVKDNIFYIRRGGSGPKYAFYTSTNDSDLVANYNNYYVHSYDGPNIIGYMSRDYLTLADWLKTRKDSSSLSIDPVFRDIAKGDFTPTKIAFENKGFNVGVTTDLFNVTRSTSKPDIGAIEFTICSPLTTPVVHVEDAETNIIKFIWNSIPNTTGYRVSRDSLNWTIPSSGAMGLSHTVSGLKPTDKISLWVKALGTRSDCPEYLSGRQDGQALTDGVFVPNTFTPNNDGKNDFFMVYSNVAKSIRWMVFNQWGEKVFESNDIYGRWDGTYKGKPQPVGVYVYVVSGMLTNGTKVSQKGTFNLVR